ncbi:hypothetical protein ACIO3O_08340 [Streptomyces sp. NPDC087440]|uniref:hypothetical protein n=1 Tax=Streptomyces sp. NPDC087440 TaxID=3365790 RepID=UPI0038168077
MQYPDFELYQPADRHAEQIVAARRGSATNNDPRRRARRDSEHVVLPGDPLPLVLLLAPDSRR